MSDATEATVPDNLVQFRPAGHQEEVRKLQVKAAVNKAEKERFERLAAKQGTKLSILIREMLELAATASGI